MVSIKEIPEDTKEEMIPPSQERLLDAVAIEEAAAKMERPTARMQLEALSKKLRKESEALKRVEKSRKLAESGDAEEKKEASEQARTSQPAAAPEKSTPVVAPPAPASAKYASIDRFSFDAGGYNSPFVTLYVPLPGVGSIERDSVHCNFTASSFDLIVDNLNGKSYRLFKDNLEKDIDVDKSKIVVKADKVVVKLAKIKSEYGSYDYWSQLTDKKQRKAGKDGSRSMDDPQKSIMEMMKNMYDEGDDNIKKMIGETMMKQQRGELGRDDIGKGLGDLDDI